MNTHSSSQRHAHSKSVQHLRSHDLASRWQMSERTLERWRSQHQGPPFLKLGGRIAYRLLDIETFEAAQLCEATGRSPAPEQGAASC